METPQRTRMKPRQYRVQQPPTARQEAAHSLKKEGRTTKDIAQQLGISPSTASTILRIAAEKKGRARSQTEPLFPPQHTIRSKAIYAWMEHSLIQEIIKRSGHALRPTEVTDKIHKQFPEIQYDGIHKRYTLPMLQALLRMGIIRNEGARTRPRYVVQWPPKPPKKYEYRAPI